MGRPPDPDLDLAVYALAQLSAERQFRRSAFLGYSLTVQKPLEIAPSVES